MRQGGNMKANCTNQVCAGAPFLLCVESQSSNNKANQLDTFFVRAAHKKWSSYLRRYA